MRSFVANLPIFPFSAFFFPLFHSSMSTLSNKNRQPRRADGRCLPPCDVVLTRAFRRPSDQATLTGAFRCWNPFRVSPVLRSLLRTYPIARYRGLSGPKPGVPFTELTTRSSSTVAASSRVIRSAFRPSSCFSKPSISSRTWSGGPSANSNSASVFPAKFACGASSFHAERIAAIRSGTLFSGLAILFVNPPSLLNDRE